MKKALIFKIFMFLLIAVGKSQTGTVEGYLRSDQEPVMFATVFLEDTKLGTTSDTVGFFRIKEVPPGKYIVRFTSIAHSGGGKSIQVEAGKVSRVNLQADEIVTETETIVISATMKEVTKSESPIPVEVYSHTYFKKNPTPNLFESLQIVNGVQPQLNCNVCNTGDIHINGMEGPYTMVTIDGMPIVSSLSTVYGLSGIPNSIVQRIEVVKGPASTLYGSEAVGGLVNVITKDPTIAPQFSLDMFATGHREFNADLSYKQKIGKATALLGINYFNLDNKRDVNEDNFTDITLQNRISVFNKWNIQRKENRLASFAGRFVYEDRWGGEMQWRREFRGGDSVYGESIFTRRYEVLGAYQLPVSKERMIVQYSVNNHQQNSVYGTTSYIATQSVGFAQLLWDKKVGEKNSLLIGLPLRYTYYDDNTPATQLSDSIHPGNNPQKVFLPGVFVQDDIILSKKLTSLAGIRYDYNSDHGNIFSPRLSFKYALNENNIVRLSGGNGYRVVNLFTEDHAALTGSRAVVIVEDLKPERSWNVNLNYQKFINHSKGYTGFDVSAFYTYFTNKIVGDFLTDPQKIIYNNLQGYAVSRGFTLNSEVSFTIPLKIIMGATFMDVYSMEKNMDGNMDKIPQLHAPGFSGTFAVTYKLKKLGIAIDYTGRVMGPMDLPVVQNDFRPSKSPWFSLQNIQLTKSFSKGWEIYGGIKNLLNFIPANPLLRPFDPFDKFTHIDNPNGYTFDTTYNYAPIQGIRGFLGVRWMIAGKE